jgi:WD40 repeat protein
VVAYRDQTLRVWDLLQGVELNALSGHSGWINAIALTEDGKQAVSSSCDSTLRLWDIDSGKELRTLAGHSGPVTHVVILSDGARVVSASTDNTIKTWDLNTGSELFSFAGFVSPAADLAVSPDGKWLTCVSENKGIRIWSNEGKEIATFMADGSVTCFAVRKNGQTIMAGDYLGRVHLLRLHQLEPHDDTSRAQIA